MHSRPSETQRRSRGVPAQRPLGSLLAVVVDELVAQQVAQALERPALPAHTRLANRERNRVSAAASPHN